MFWLRVIPLNTNKYLCCWHGKMTNIAVFWYSNIRGITISCIDNFFTITYEVRSDVIKKKAIKSSKSFPWTEDFVTEQEKHSLVYEDCHPWRGDKSSQRAIVKGWLGIKRILISNHGSCTPSCSPPSSARGIHHTTVLLTTVVPLKVRSCFEILKVLWSKESRSQSLTELLSRPLVRFEVVLVLKCNIIVLQGGLKMMAMTLPRHRPSVHLDAQTFWQQFGKWETSCGWFFLHSIGIYHGWNLEWIMIEGTLFIDVIEINFPTCGLSITHDVWSNSVRQWQKFVTCSEYLILERSLRSFL